MVSKSIRGWQRPRNDDVPDYTFDPNYNSRMGTEPWRISRDLGTGWTVSGKGLRPAWGRYPIVGGLLSGGKALGS